MSKILFIGDPHLDSRTPISRLDDYGITTINKLESLLNLAITNGDSHVITTGDVFDKYDISLSYLNNVIQVLNKFKENNIQVYSLIGNHDLPHDKKEYFDRTPLHILFSTGLMKHLTKLEIDNSCIYGLDFTERDNLPKIVEGLSSEKINILTMHYATDNTVPNDSIERKDLKSFNLVVSGHDHTYYPIQPLDNPIVLRMGSFTRRTKDKQNITRSIIVYEVDTTNGSYKELILPNVLPSDKVFKSEIFNPTFNNILGLEKNFEDIFNEEYFKKENLSLYDIVDSLPDIISNDTKEELKRYFKSLNI